MREKGIQLGYDIAVDSGSILKPTGIEFWSKASKFEKNPSSAPFKYMADALLGLSVIKLNPYLKSPLHLVGVDFNFCNDAWRTLDPHFELFQRSQVRVQSLKSPTSSNHKLIIENFEKSFVEILESAVKPWGFDFRELLHLIDSINFLEEKLKNPLLYNFSIGLEKSSLEKLHWLYSLLFHLRAVIALDHNAHCEDTTFEGVHCDAITDYIPKAEYVSNDALLYYQFKKITHPFTHHRGKDARIEKLLVEPLLQSFQQYSHNAYCLIENLPPTFLQQLNLAEVEEALHLVQMDWVLGSQAGLLFKIREELFGLQNGYDQIFWTDVIRGPIKKPSSLSISLHISEADVFAQRAG